MQVKTCRRGSAPLSAGACSPQQALTKAKALHCWFFSLFIVIFPYQRHTLPVQSHILALSTFQGTLALLQPDVCGLGTLPSERVSVQHPTKASAFCISPSLPHFPVWFIPLDLQITLRGGLQECLAVARLCWLKSDHSNVETWEGFSLLYIAVLFSSHFQLLMRCESNYNLRVVRLQQGEIHFVLFYISNLYMCREWWTRVEHGSLIRIL